MKHFQKESQRTVGHETSLSVSQVNKIGLLQYLAIFNNENCPIPSIKKLPK